MVNQSKIIQEIREQPTQLKQIVVRLKSEKSIEKRIKQLKEQLHQIQSGYVVEIYRVLKEIYMLRKKQFPRYSFLDMSNEKGMNFKRHHLIYVFHLDFVSPKTAELINKGKIKATSVIKILQKSRVFRIDLEQQDKIIQAYLNKHYTIRQISYFPLNSLLTFINTDKEKHLHELDKKRFDTIYTMKSLAVNLTKNKNLFKDNKSKDSKKNFQQLKANFDLVKMAVDDVLEDIYKCPYCKHKLKLSELKSNNKNGKKRI